MNKYLLIGIVIIVTVGVLFLAKGMPTQLPSTSQQYQTQPQSTAVNTMTVVLNEQNNSGETGTATLEEADGMVTVTLMLTGAPEGVSQPAHIHAGSCPEVGKVVYPLSFPEDGDSETSLETTFADLQNQMPLAINVHKSVAEASVYVSCGDLTF